MGFGEAISTCLRKYVGFSGRARRSEYWWFVLFNILVGIAAGILDGVLGLHSSTPGGSGPIDSLATLVLLLPNLAVTVRRFHDTNRSGFWVLGFYLGLIAAIIAMFVLLFGGNTVPGALAGLVAFGLAVWMLVITVLKGTDGTNRYGPDPFAANQAEVFT